MFFTFFSPWSSDETDLVVTTMVTSSVVTPSYSKASLIMTNKSADVDVHFSTAKEQSHKRKREDTASLPSLEELLSLLEDFLAECTKKGHFHHRQHRYIQAEVLLLSS